MQSREGFKMGPTPVRAAPQGVAVGYDILGYQPKARRCTETKLFPPATSGRAFHRKSVLKREKEKARPGHDLASWANPAQTKLPGAGSTSPLALEVGLQPPCVARKHRVPKR
jgi:hypothetical protein